MKYNLHQYMLMVAKAPIVGLTLAIATVTTIATVNPSRANPNIAAADRTVVQIETKGEILPQCKIEGVKSVGVLKGPGSATQPFTTKTQQGGSPIQLTVSCNYNTSAKIANAQTADSVTPTLPSGSTVQHSFGSADAPGTGLQTGAAPTTSIGTGNTPIYIHSEASNARGLPTGKYTVVPMLSIP
jgi:hypothetical protein